MQRSKDGRWWDEPPAVSRHGYHVDCSSMTRTSIVRDVFRQKREIAWGVWPPVVAQEILLCPRSPRSGRQVANTRCYSKGTPPMLALVSGQTRNYFFSAASCGTTLDDRRNTGSIIGTAGCRRGAAGILSYNAAAASSTCWPNACLGSPRLSSSRRARSPGRRLLLSRGGERGGEA